MKNIKKIIKYILIFGILVLILTTLLAGVARIPKKYVEKNLKKAITYFENNNAEIKRTKRNKKYSYLHIYADEIILNIIYCLDTQKPLKSVLEAKYYTEFQNDGSNKKYVKLIQNNLQPNTEYLRYWHGSIIIVKPLLTILTLEQIYILNLVILIILLGMLIALLIKKKYYSIALALVIGLIAVAIWYVPFCFEYMWTFIIMIVASIISLKIESNNYQNKNQKLYMLYFITGMLTCFFDFLTTEIITILIPITIVLSIRMKENRLKDLKQEATFLIKSLLVWGISYSFMWISKWAISSVVLNINAIDFVKDRAMERINGKIADIPTWKMMIITIRNNLTTLYPINIIEQEKSIVVSIIIAIIVLLILTTDKKSKEKIKYMFLMIAIGIIPYIRYVVLLNHSYRHSFFTFRSQLTTIMCIVLILVNCSDKKKLLSNIKMGKDKNEK